MATLDTVLAVTNALGATIAKETRRALREHEDQLTTLIRSTVSAAIAEMLIGPRDD
jgi:hypothetical protein